MFIVVEGIDGSGKSTQVARLVDHLQHSGHDVVQCSDPGATPIGWEVRAILQNRELSPCPEADLLLYTACRVELWNKIIKPALDEGKIVVCDRFVNSTYAYQICGKEREPLVEEMVRLHETFIGEYADLTIFIDVPIDVAAERTAKRKGEVTRFESYKSDFFDRVRNGYLECVEANPDDYLVIDGSDDQDGVFAQIIEGINAVADQAKPVTE